MYKVDLLGQVNPEVNMLAFGERVQRCRYQVMMRTSSVAEYECEMENS